MSRNIIDLLATSSLFGGIPAEKLETVHPKPEWISIKAGETLIHQGEEGDAFYLLVDGRLRAFVRGTDGVTRRVGEVYPGEGVGEMSLLTDELTSATVRAMHDSELIRFSRESYMQLMINSPEAALHITRTITRRLRQGLDGHGSRLPYAAITVLPVDQSVNTREFCLNLSTRLNEFASCQVLNSNSLGVEYAEMLQRRDPLESLLQRKVSLKINECQHQSQLTVYEAEFYPTQWTRFCLRQADIVLLVAGLEANTELSETEALIIDRLDKDLVPEVDMVFLHGDCWRQKSRLNSWFQNRAIKNHFHLRQWREDDFARLARHLTGNSVGLTLGGGGARGFAQIGVIKALLEAKIPIDRIGSTSMGAFIGALYALGMDIDEMKSLSAKIWIEGKPLSDYTYPAMSLVRGRRLHGLIEEALHGWEIEDLPIPFFCVSSNLTKEELFVHDRGTLWKAVRASGSIPGAGPPMFINGNILVDGGVLNNLPVDLMYKKYGGLAIVVDVSQQQPIQVPMDFEEVPSGWHILLNRLNPFSVSMPLPSLFEILYRTATLSSSRSIRIANELADLLIIPPLEKYGTLEFDKLDEIIEVGYRYTVEQLFDVNNTRLAQFTESG